MLSKQMESSSVTETQASSRRLAKAEPTPASRHITSSAFKRAKELLAIANIEINGQSACDIQVHNATLYDRVLAGGSLALGESYMDGWWDCGRLDEFFCRLLASHLEDHVHPWQDGLAAVRARMLNLQSRTRAFIVGREHYDLGNDLYERMLDQRMIYSCGYWKRADSLDAAQEAKLDLICRKLQLRPGMRVLDIGCGWGGAARFAAERYGVSVVGLTISTEQADYARSLNRNLPIDIRMQDYRELNETFDRIYSIGMFEHVGQKNYRAFMKTVQRCLVDNGLFLLHTIGGLESTNRIDPWIDRYIFPNATLPSARQITKACEGLFVLEDWQNFGADYDRTLMAWYRRIRSRWGELAHKYDERFYRMWKYYLLACAGGFRARRNQLWQLVLSPDGVAGVYHSPR